MQRTPPRHLAPPSRSRPKAREHLLAESILALVAIGITTVILIGSLLDRPESSAGWRPVGKAGLDRAPDGRRGGWALRLTRGSSRQPGLVHPEVTTLKGSKRYEAAVWFRASRPGIEVQVNLFELRGGKRFAVDTVGAVATAGAWRRLDVSHDAHRNGAVLAVEILAPTLTSGTNLLVDDLEVRAASSAMSSH
jgi:hypothetical protein